MMAIDKSGGLYAWGNNVIGQIGDGTTISRSTPTYVTAYAPTTYDSWKVISASNLANGHVLAIRSLDSSLWGWGNNSSFQLGDGTTISKSSPTLLNSSRSWKSVSAGNYHSIALAETGGLYAWGNNAFGQIGDGTTVQKTSPIQIGSSSWSIVSAGFNTTIATKSDFALFGWGLNNSGQLGQGDTINRSSPVQIAAAGVYSSWKSIATGRFHTLAIRNSDSSLWAWGYNGNGQLGDNTTVTKSYPVQIDSGSWISVGAGWQHSIAAAANGAVYAWGWNTSGQLGDNTSVSKSTPTAISTLINPPRLLQTNNSFYMNGGGTYIKIADDTNRSNTLYPQLRPSGDFTLEMWVYLTANNTSIGSLYTYGSSMYWPGAPTSSIGIQLEYNLGRIYIRSTGATYTANFPANRTLETNRWYHIALVRNSNTLTAYVDGQAGASVSSATGRIDPIAADYRDSNTAIWLSIKSFPEGPGGRTYSTNYYNQIRFVSNSAVYTANFTPSTSELGNITNTQLLIKQKANTLYDASNNSFIVYNKNGSNFDSGSEFNNPAGAIFATSFSPFSNPLSANAIFVTAGGNSSAYISNTNILMVWGEGNYGQLGTNTTITRVLPSAVGDETWKFINFGKSALHTSAITTSNIIYTWGYNLYGQLGDGTTVSKSTPVLTNLSTLEMSESSLGQFHSVAKSANNNVFAWGYNAFGQLGDGSFTNRSRPVKIGNISLRTNDTNYNSIRYYSSQKHTAYFNVTGLSVSPSRSLTVECFVYLRDEDIGGPIVTHINNGSLQNALFLSLTSSANTSTPSSSTSVDNLYPWVGYCTNTNSPSTNWFGVGALNPITKNVWHHIAGVYSANTGEISIYVNGTKDNSITRNWGSYTTEAGQQFRLGRNDQSSVNDAITFKGNISNFRLILGNTLPYFGSTYTVPTAPLTSTSGGNTIFVSAQSDRFVDNSNGTYQLIPEIISGTFNPQITGENPFTTQYTPLSDTMTVGAGRFYSGAVTNAGQLFMWGYNGLGYLANNSTETLEYPEKIIGTTTWSKISLGEEAVTAVASNGSIFTWGSGQQDEFQSYFATYQLGDGTSYRSTPSMISSTNENSAYFVYDSWIYISAGANNIAAITTSNTLYTWGNNIFGQIGDGTTLSRSNPAQISSSWKAVSVGGSHMIAVDYTNKLYAWGNNRFGQVGDGSTINKSFPVAVALTYSTSVLNPGLNNSIYFDGNLDYADTNANSSTVIGTNDYTIEAWIYPTASANTFNPSQYVFSNDELTANYNNSTRRIDFTNVGAFDIFGTEQLTANSWNHIAFTRQGSTVKLYTNGILNSSTGSGSYNITGNYFRIGRNYFSSTSMFTGYISNFRLLIGEALYTGNTYTVPTSAPGLNANTALLLCAANTAIDSSNNNVSVTLFGNSAVSSLQPFGYPEVTGISAGANTSAFVTQNIVLTTGLNTGSQLGDLSATNRTTPVVVAQSGNTVSAGANNTFYIATNNYLYGWGSVTANNGTIGDGTTISKSSPVLIATRASWSIVSSANDYTLGILTTGALYAWGKNNFGQHGDGTTLAKSSTVQIGTSSWSFVSAAANNVAALSSNKILFTWGRNNFGQLGDGTTIDKSSPVQIGTSSWTSVSMNDHALATTIDGALFAWGSNEYGSLGDNTITDKSSPIQIGTSSWTFVDAGFKGSLAIDAQGELFAWGLNNVGQLGLGNLSNKSSPIQVGTTYKGYTPYSWTSVSVGDFNTVGLTSEGSLYTWGVGTVGVLGDGTTVSKSRPVKIGNSSWSFISAGPSHVAAIDTNSALYAWGLNASGQLGNGTTENKSSPVAVIAHDNTVSWKYVSAGFSATSAISSNNLLYVWGTSTGNTGILGLGTSITARSSAVQIGTSSWTMVNAGFGTMVGQTAYGNLYGWGNNVVGLINQYGPGNYGYGATNNAIFTPEQIGILNQISPTIIAAEGEGTLVMGVDSSGITHVLGAGLNDSGQLGNGTIVNNNYLEVVYKGNNRAQLYSGANTAYRIGEQGNTSIII
jgi:alpha-tubulin suppressor-like RCC1 family protein